MEFDDYRDKYENIWMERKDGVLTIFFHTQGDSLKWNDVPHRDFGLAFADIAADQDNKLVIMTGTGDNFCTEWGGNPPVRNTPMDWDPIYRNGKLLLTNLLNIEVPIIAVINGPASIHAEIALLSDIVLMAEEAFLQDAPHFPKGIVPGDGAHVIWPLLLGPNRGRYFLLTGQKLSANEALNLGVVNEVLPKALLLERAFELAELLVQKPQLTLRYTRISLTLYIKRLMNDMLGYGLAMEGLGIIDQTMKGK